VALRAGLLVPQAQLARLVPVARQVLRVPVARQVLLARQAQRVLQARLARQALPPMWSTPAESPPSGVEEQRSRGERSSGRRAAIELPALLKASPQPREPSAVVSTLAFLGPGAGPG
jgi:hypothetical protein